MSDVADADLSVSTASQSLGEIWALVLAGGLGSRLRSVVADRQKVMAPVRGRPFVTFILDQLASGGIRNVVLCTGHLAEQLERDLGSSYGPMRIVYSVEPTPLGTGGALALGVHRCDTQTVLALNGDSYCQTDLTMLLKTHFQRDATATIQLAHAPDVARYGQVRLAADGRVTSFEEKGASHGAGWVNAGIYCLSRSVLEGIPAGRSISIEREVFPSLIGNGLFGFASDARLLDIGTPESYAQAESFTQKIQENHRLHGSHG